MFTIMYVSTDDDDMFVCTVICVYLQLCNASNVNG